MSCERFTDAELAEFKAAQRLAYEATAAIEAELYEGMTEKQATPIWNHESDRPCEPGLWAIEPHIGKGAIGVEREELTGVTDDGAYWLDLDSAKTNHAEDLVSVARRRLPGTAALQPPERKDPRRRQPVQSVQSARSSPQTRLGLEALHLGAQGPRSSAVAVDRGRTRIPVRDSAGFGRGGVVLVLGEGHELAAQRGDQVYRLRSFAVADHGLLPCSGLLDLVKH
jgi:hypothetical protein